MQKYPKSIQKAFPKYHKSILMYPSLFQPVPAHSSLFQSIPAYSYLFQPISANSSISQPIQPIQIYSNHLQPIAGYFKISSQHFQTMTTTMDHDGQRRIHKPFRRGPPFFGDGLKKAWLYAKARCKNQQLTRIVGAAFQWS